MSQFRPDVEGLRALAILLVVLYHAGVPGVTGGYVGVDVFFVVSGYLITSLLLRELHETGSIRFLTFYARRARRLLPAMALMVLGTMAVGAVLFAPVEQDGLANTAISTVLYASNLYFTRASTDYLAAPSHANPLLHTWSLSVEEQFYLVWPVLMLALAGRGDRPAPTRRARLLIGMAALALVSFAAAVYLTHRVQPWSFFLSPPRAWEFAIGGLATLLDGTGLLRSGDPAATRRTSVPRTVILVGGWMGLAGVIGAGFLYNRTTVFPGTTALLPVVATALMLSAGALAPEAGVARVLGMKPFREIGRLSYSWYLWHWPVLMFATAMTDTLSVVQRLALAFVALVIAEGSYRFVEAPIRHSRTLVLRPRYSLALVAIVTCGGVVIGVTWKIVAARWAELPAQAAFSRMKNDFPAIYRMGCDDYFRSAKVIECPFGPSDAPHTAVLLGDSHAGHWFPAVSRLFSDLPGWRFVVLTKSACPIVDAPVFSEELGREYTECREWLRNALLVIGRLHPDLVLVSNHGYYPFTPDVLRAGLQSATRALGAASGAVVLLRDVPPLGFDGPNCLARLAWRPAFARGSMTCRSTPSDDELDRTYQVQRHVASIFQNVSTLDMTPAVCPDRVCRVVQNGLVSYRDSGHLSTAFSSSLAGALGQALTNVLKTIPGSDFPSMAGE